MVFDRITVDPDKMGGVPSIRGLRVPVAMVVGMVADGMGEEKILGAYPDLEREDVREALRYTAEAVKCSESGREGSKRKGDGPQAFGYRP